jgi:hypothetical protein
MMHIISTTHGYVITDGLSFVRTFLVNAYESRQACFYAALTLAIQQESVWCNRNHRPERGRIVRKVGVIRQQSVEQPAYKVQRTLL